MKLNDELKEKINAVINNSQNIKNLFEQIGLEYNVNSRSYRLVKKYITEYFDGKMPLRFNGRISRISLVSRDVLQKYYDNSSSISEILNKFYLHNAGGNANTLKRIAKELNISYYQFKKNQKIKIQLSNDVKSIYALSIDEIMKRARKSIKKYIIHHNLIDYKCDKCGNLGEHNGLLLVLQLDHINGINDDNRLNNLRFLCPNCHSQTKTFAGKNLGKTVTYCSDCGKVITNNSIRCKKCAAMIYRKRKFEISKDELEKLINEMPMTKVGKIYGVSDNAIRHRCNTLGITLKVKNIRNKIINEFSNGWNDAS